MLSLYIAQLRNLAILSIKKRDVRRAVDELRLHGRKIVSLLESTPFFTADDYYFDGVASCIFVHIDFLLRPDIPPTTPLT